MAENIVPTTTTGSDRGRKILITGEVVSNKMAKTICVQVFRTVRHAKYGKFLKRSSIFKAHDEKSTAQVGDVVEIRETRPLSKTKRFQLVRVITKGPALDTVSTGGKIQATGKAQAGKTQGGKSKTGKTPTTKKISTGAQS